MLSDPNNPHQDAYPSSGTRHRSETCPQREISGMADALAEAAPLLRETLACHWSTGQGTRVRHIIWSLYTCSHLVNLGDACSGLDGRLAGALATAITARLILGPEVESTLRVILEASGEFARFDEAEKHTPGHLPVLYPPAAAGPEELRRMADAIDHRAAKSTHR